MSRLMEIEKENPSLVSEFYLIHSIQEKISSIMTKKGITQTMLAEKMGLKKAQISRLLSDNRNLNIRTIARIFLALGEELQIITKNEVSRMTRTFSIESVEKHNQIWQHRLVQQGSIKKEKEVYPKKSIPRSRRLYAHLIESHYYGK